MPIAHHWGANVLTNVLLCVMLSGAGVSQEGGGRVGGG